MKFHDELNPKLWDKIINQETDEEQYELKTEVADKLKEIAQAFIEYLDINEEAIKDVVITGSSASYNYTPHSDLDLHLKVDYELVHEDCPLVENYLFALKGGFNKIHDISIYGVPVEVYAENIEGDTVHNGLYSLWQGKWIDIPRKIPPTKNDEAVLAKYNEIKDACNKIEDSEVAEELLNKIYEMRKAGLSRNGEFSVENLAFKKLRDNGIIDRLKQMKKEKIDKQLTLESYKNKSIKESEDKNKILPYIKSCLRGIKGIIPNDIYIDTDIIIININNGANVTKIKEQIYNRLKDTWVNDYLKGIELKQGMLIIPFKESITEEIDMEAKLSNKNEDINTLYDKDKELKELIQVIKSNKHEDTDIKLVFKELGKNIISNFKQKGYPKTDKFLMDFANVAIQEFEQNNPNYKIQLNIDNGDLVLTLIDKQNNKSFYQLWINSITKRVKYSDLENSNYMFENINRNESIDKYYLVEIVYEGDQISNYTSQILVKANNEQQAIIKAEKEFKRKQIGELIRSSIIKVYNTKKEYMNKYPNNNTTIVESIPSKSRRGRINYEDDIVYVYKGKQEIYKGIEDYEPMKDENWKWNEKDKCYTLGEYTKYCLSESKQIREGIDDFIITKRTLDNIGKTIYNPKYGKGIITDRLYDGTWEVDFGNNGIQILHSWDISEDCEGATELLEKIYNMRKTGLAEAGEFCTENLAFKKLRNEGCMDKLRKIKKEQFDKQLSLESYNDDYIDDLKFMLRGVTENSDQGIKQTIINKLNELPVGAKLVFESIKGQSFIRYEEEKVSNVEWMSKCIDISEQPEKTFIKIKVNSDIVLKHLLEATNNGHAYDSLNQVNESIKEDTYMDKYKPMYDKTTKLAPSWAKIDFISKMNPQDLVNYAVKAIKRNDANIVDVENMLNKANYTPGQIEDILDMIRTNLDEAYLENENKNESIKEGFNKGDKVQLKRKNNKIGIVKSIFNGDKDKNDKYIKYLDVEFEDGTKEGRPALDFKKINESIKEDYDDVSEEMHKERFVTYFETPEGGQKYKIYHVYTDSTDDSYNELCDKRDNQLGMYNSYKELKDALKEKAEKIAAKQGWTVKSIENLGEDEDYYRERNKWESCNEKVEETKNYKRTRLAEPNTCKKGSFRTKQVNDKGDKLVFCKDKETNKMKAQSKLIKKNEALQEPIKINSKVKDKTGRTGKVIGVNVKDKTVDVELDNTVTYDNDELELLEFFKRKGE